jgi:tetratricopeptide (TPR) repeat protein
MRDRLVLVPHGDRSAPVPDHPAPRARLAVVLVAGLAALGSAGAPDLQVNPRAIVVLPFDASSLSPGDQWMSEAIAQAISLGLAQQPGLVQIERDRLSAVVDPAVWSEMHVSQAGQAVRADAALYGSIGRKDSHLLLQPRLLDIKSGQTTSLPPTRFADAELLTQFASLSVVYARALQPALTDAEKARIEKAARPTGSVQALELFARGQTAIYNGENERAISLLVQATQADPGFAVASYSLGVVHSALGNRWKAAAQFRAALQLDALMPEPLKAIGDLFLSAPRNLFDQAIEAYSAAIKLRHFYADAYVGLGNAYAAKGEIDRALTAYQAALTFDPFDARTHVRLGQSYAKQGRCAEAVNSYRQAGELDRRSVVVATPCP